jgi:uncharacterized protein (DUF697 family)
VKAPERQGASGAASWLGHVRSRVDLKAVDAEARKRVRLIVVGPRRSEFLDALTAAGPFAPEALRTAETLLELSQTDIEASRAAVHCPDVDATSGEGQLERTTLRIADLPFPVFIVRTGEASTLDEGRLSTSPASSKPTPGALSIYYVSSMSLPELRKYLLPDIARAYHGNEIALAAAVPAFRPIVAAKLTMDSAMNSLQIAAVSAIADHIPVLGLITGSIASAGDTIAITALQMRMLLRIASAYGKKPEFARILELLPVVGGGYAWRALAREASGFIPIAGIPIKAAVAYAGTLVVGQAASHYYETGLKMSPSAISALYREASERAKEFFRHFIGRKKRAP